MLCHQHGKKLFHPKTDERVFGRDWWSYGELNPGLEFEFCKALHVYLVLVFAAIGNKQTMRHRIQSAYPFSFGISTPNSVPRYLLSALVARIRRRLLLGESQVSNGHLDIVKRHLKVHRGNLI